MLIGIDMMGVQSPESSDGQVGRFGRQLVSALLRFDPSNRYVLYVHDGLPVDRLPLEDLAERIALGPLEGESRCLPSIHRIIEENPDGLDWLLLLDPFARSYGENPSESALNGLKLASLVFDMAPSMVDDRRLAPLRHHDAILAVSEATASECRRRMGSAAQRVSTVPVAIDVRENVNLSPSTDPDEDLRGLGINGPFLFANLTGGSERGNLGGILEAYLLLSEEDRGRHQLVISGTIDDPWGVVGYLHDGGCTEGYVLAGEVVEATLGLLYRRCTAFVTPSIEEGSGLSLVEAMRCGAPIVAGMAGDQPEVVGEAGLLVDPTDAGEIAEAISRLIAEDSIRDELRDLGLARAARFGWKPAVSQVIEAFRAGAATALPPQFRADLAHPIRPRAGTSTEALEGSTLESFEAFRDED